MLQKLFSVDRLDVLRRIEQEHFWFRGRRALVMAFLNNHPLASTDMLLDIGCGTGHNLAVWGKYARRVVGLDRYAEWASAERGAFRIAGDAEHVPLADATIDIALALDVIEHVCDRSALAECHRVMRPGGLLCATVPAWPWLWGIRDEDAGHRRRYTPAMLRERLQAAGFAIETLCFYQFFLFPAVLVSRLGGKRRRAARNLEDRPPGALNGLLARINIAEASLSARGWRFPIGSSLIVVARKV